MTIQGRVVSPKTHAARIISEEAAMTTPLLRIGTLGDYYHGKSSLAFAIVARQRHLGRYVHHVTAPEILRQPPVHRDNRDAPGFHRIYQFQESIYETSTRRYVHLDDIGQEGHIKSLLTDAGREHGAILVVAGNLGLTAPTREQVRLARLVGIPRFVVFVSKVDLQPDPDLLDLVEWEVRELLCQHEYRGDDVPIIRGNPRAVLDTAAQDDSVARSIDELLAALDESLPLPEPEKDKPFLMPIEGLVTLGEEHAVSGRVLQGSLPVGAAVEIVGLRSVVQRASITAVQFFSQPVPAAECGYGVGILLTGVARSDLERGMVLAAPGSIRAHTRFEAIAYVLRPEEGGRQSAFFSDYRPQFQFHGIDLGGRITLRGTDVGVPGEVVEITVELYAGLPVAMEVGTRFAIREGSRTVGVGTVTRLPLS
jgi:elongation factor Tu